VLWIGGATDSGKTSVAKALAERFGLQAYHLDRYDREEPPGHWSRTDPVRHPHMHAAPTRDRDWMWVHTTPEALVERWFRTAPERFQLVLEDLLALPTAPLIVAEGYGFTPELVQPLLSSTRQAIWLISTEEFKRASYARRGKDPGKDTSDPERARYNHLNRDLLLAEHFRRSAKERGLPILEIDGSRSLDEVITYVEAHVAPFLERASKASKP
jgi:2-phosphoglycerate kinase